MKNLVIGASGLVGGHLYRLLKNRGEEVEGTFSHFTLPGLISLNIQNLQEVLQTIGGVKPDVIYLPAALTNVDYCESNPEISYQINVDGVTHVISAAKQVDAKLVFYSTDYIFRGDKGPYTEDDEQDPICEYGRHKVISERNILNVLKDSLIIRTTNVFGWENQGKNFVYRLINTLKRNEKIKVPDDQISTPAYAPDLAAISVELVDKKMTGVFNIVGPDLLSRADFAKTVSKVFSLDENLIEPVSTTSLKQLAPRPLHGGLVYGKAKKFLEYQISGLETNLRLMKKEELKF